MCVMTLAHQEDFDIWRDAAPALAASEVGRRVGKARRDRFAAARDIRYRLGCERAKAMLSSSGVVPASGE